MIKFIKKHKWNLVFLMFFALYFIPQTGMPIKVFIQRLVAFSPSEISEKEQEVIDTYQWKLQPLENESVNFSSSEGKVIVVNFWATWCPPCIAEMPSLQRLYEVYGNQVDFYFVTTESHDVVQQFMKNKGYTFPVFIEQSAPPEVLQTRELPTTFLISKEGAIVIKKKGVAKWDSDSVKTTIDNLLQNR